MKRVLILSYSHLGTDPRILRQVEALKGKFHLTTAGYSAINDATVDFQLIYKEPPFSLPRKIKRFAQFLFRRFDAYYWDQGKVALAARLQQERFDVIIANDIHTLPLALRIAGTSGKVYFDAHEYHPLEFEDNILWQVFHRPRIIHQCKKYILLAHAFSTVSMGIAEEYEKFIGKKPEVITNATFYKSLQASLVSEKIKLVHHSAAIRGRKIETFIEIMSHLRERFELTLILTGSDKKYIEELKLMARDKKNIHFLPPVSFHEICGLINQFDIGLICLPPDNFNNLNSLPNKFFEFIQARLAIVTSPNPEMQRIVNEYRLGCVTSGFDAASFVRVLEKLTPDQVMQFKKHSDEAAHSLNANENMKKIAGIVEQLAQA